MKTRKIVKYEDFEKARLKMITTDKSEKMVKYEDFDKAWSWWLEMITTEKNEVNGQIYGFCNSTSKFYKMRPGCST